LDDYWANWLVELNRILAPGGRMILTFMGEGMSQVIANQPWDEAAVGMSVYRPGNPWDAGGPMVLMSPWWIREHFGRLFDVEKIEPMNFAMGNKIIGVHQHGYVVLRKTDRVVSVAELETPNPKEINTIYQEMLRLRKDAAKFRGDHAWQYIGGRTAFRALLAAIKRLVSFSSKSDSSIKF
jgi:hypothetical protein